MAEELFTDYGGMGRPGEGNVKLFSEGGKGRTVGEFETALKLYHATGQQPKGFVIHGMGSYGEQARSLFEGMNVPLQQAAPDVGGFLAKHIPGLGVAEAIQPGITQTVEQGGRQTGATIAEDVSTPRKAGMTAALGILPMTGAMKAVTVAGKLSKAGILGNMAKGAVVGGTGSTLMDAALGGQEPFNPAKVAADFVLAGVNTGIQGVLGHAINKYIRPDLQEEVAGKILKPIADKYKNYGNDPTLFDAAWSNKDTVEHVTAQMSKSIMGTVDQVADQFKGAVVSGLPTIMDKASQNTLRMHLRHATSAAQHMLDAGNDTKAVGIAEGAMNDALEEAGKFVVDKMKASGIKNFTKDDVNLAEAMKQFKDGIDTFKEGAHVLSALKRSGQDKGFDPMAFREALLDAGYNSGGPQSVMAKVGKELGMGASLSQTQEPPSATGLLDKLLGQQLRRIPIVGKHLIPSAPAPNPMMPWMLQKQGAAATAGGIGAVSSGQDAIDSFMNRGGTPGTTHLSVNIDKMSPKR